MSVIVSILVAAAVSPCILNMRARGWSRSKAAAAGTVGAVGVIVGALILIALAIVPYMVQILQAVQQAIVVFRRSRPTPDSRPRSLASSATS